MKTDADGDSPSSDKTAPCSLSRQNKVQLVFTPIDGSSGVPVTITPSVQFSEPMNPVRAMFEYGNRSVCVYPGDGPIRVVHRQLRGQLPEGDPDADSAVAAGHAVSIRCLLLEYRSCRQSVPDVRLDLLHDAVASSLCSLTAKRRNIGGEIQHVVVRKFGDDLLHEW
jgi:hypothetical protein